MEFCSFCLKLSAFCITFSLSREKNKFQIYIYIRRKKSRDKKREKVEREREWFVEEERKERDGDPRHYTRVRI